MRVLACGGRDYADRQTVFEALSELQDVTLIIHGGARGADALAGEWAQARTIPCLRHPANWAVYGRSAGAVRNQDMLTAWRPQLVVAFPGGAGTGHMVRIAREAGIEVRVVA